MKSQEWPQVRESIQTEINALISRDVFDHLKSRDEIPSGMNIFKLLLLLKRKRGKHHEISKYKARLVMDGSKAVIGKDENETFSPVVDYSTVRLLVSLFQVSCRTSLFFHMTIDRSIQYYCYCSIC